MGFEVFVPKTGPRALEAGICTIQAHGLACFHTANLMKAAINGDAVILVDAGTQRVAIRAPREEEGMVEPTVLVRRTKCGTSGRINLRGAIAACGVEPAAVKGRRPVHHKDGLLIVELAGAGTAAQAPEKRRPGRPRKGATA